MKAPLFLIALAAAAPAVAQSGARYTIEESGRGFNRLQDAVSAIGGGDGTITIAPGRYRDCAVQEGGRVAYRAEKPGTVIFDGGICEDKAALVLRGRDSVVDGITFTNMRVGDGNGAGIRFERGGLTVRNASFTNSQQGILAADDRSGVIRIDRSSFSGLGTCEFSGGCAHSLYIGHVASLTVTRSRFDRGMGGHYVKTRSARTEVTDSSFDDTRGQGTNYMIDLSSGSNGLIARNVFVQGANKENHAAFVTVAPEGRDNRSAGLEVRDNKASLAPDVEWSTIFVADWSGENLRIGANQLAAGIKPFERIE